MLALIVVFASPNRRLTVVVARFVWWRRTPSTITGMEDLGQTGKIAETYPAFLILFT